MSFLKNIKLNYTTKVLNECIENNSFSEFQKNYEKLKKIDSKIANKFIKYNSTSFIENDELNFLFNKNFIWLNSYRKQDVSFLSNIITQIFKLSSTKNMELLNFYEEVLKVLDDDEIKEYQTPNDIFLKSHYYFQMLLDNHHPGTKLVNTSSAFYEFDKKIHFTHHKLTRCYFYVIKHPYQIFADLKNRGFQTQEALSILCNFEDRPDTVEIQRNNKKLFCPEITKSWTTNVLSWTNKNVQSSLRGLTLYDDDLLNKTEDKIIEIAAHLKESGIEIELNPLQLSKISHELDSTKTKNITPELSNKEKKIIDRECGELIEKFFSNRFI
jgi:hypothetical protein